MTSTDIPDDIKSEPRGTRFDRPVLVSNLVSGAACLLLASPFVPSPPLLLVGAVYVAAASAFLAAVYAREALTRKQEALAWVVPWLVAVALWAAVGSGIEGGNSGSDWLLLGWFGLCIGTPCYLAWQIGALAVRQLMAWQSRTAAEQR